MIEIVRVQVQALIQGRASLWQQNLVLTPTKGGAGDPVGRAAHLHSSGWHTCLPSARKCTLCWKPFISHRCCKDTTQSLGWP